MRVGESAFTPPLPKGIRSHQELPQPRPLWPWVKASRVAPATRDVRSLAVTSRCGPIGEPTILARFFEERGLYRRPCYGLALEGAILNATTCTARTPHPPRPELMSPEDLRGCLGEPQGFQPSKTREFPGNFRMTELLSLSVGFRGGVTFPLWHTPRPGLRGVPTTSTPAAWPV